MSHAHIEHEIALSLAHRCGDEALSYLQQLPHCTYERTTHLLNVYFDTPTQDLRRAKAALRLRFDTQAQRWLQTLKTAGTTQDGMSARHEWEVALSDDAHPSDFNDRPDCRLDAFAADAQLVLRPLEGQLQAIFHTDFQRDIFQYRQDEHHFEIALDRGEIRPDGAHTDALTRIQDIEIEFVHGDLSAMSALATHIQTALQAQPQTLSKAARGYALTPR